MKMSMQDPYAVLGVRRNAGPDEIKAAWRAMAKAIHPDQNREDQNATARFAEASRAYEVLKDPRMRNRYDQARRDADLRRMEEMKRRAEGKSQAEQPVGAETAEEAVSRIFGTDPVPPAARTATATATARPTAAPPPRANAHTEAKTAEAKTAEAKTAEAKTAEAKTGETKTGETLAPDDMRGDIDAPAADAPASGAQAGPGILARAASPAADLVSSLFRRIIPSPASPDAGEKTVEKTAADRIPDLVCEAVTTVEDIFHSRRVTAMLPDGQGLKVALPPGTTDGSTIRLREQGYKQGTARGDALVGIRVSRHERFRVDGADLHTTLPVSLHDAVLGCTTTVKTVTGHVSLTVPPWSGPDRSLRVPGQGLPDAQGGRGDLIVELSLTLAERPDPKLYDLLRSQRDGLVL